MTEPSPSGSYADFFHALTERDPYPYQERLGTEPWPDLLDVPTGLGKTAAAAWPFHRSDRHSSSPLARQDQLSQHITIETLEFRTLCARGAWSHLLAKGENHG